MIEFGHGTHIGLRRTRNEDTYYADVALGLFLVADGIGGHRHGEVAAAMVRDAVVDMVSRGHVLSDAIRSAGAQLLDHAHGDKTDALPMGATVAVLRLVEGGYEAAWVGDSRIYLWREGLRQISHDPSFVQELVASGQLDPGQADRRARCNVVTQALGITAIEQLHVGMARGQLQQGMAFLLCSDGLTEEVDERRLAAIVGRQDMAAQECVDHLLLAALDGGGKDNVTAILARVR